MRKNLLRKLVLLAVMVAIPAWVAALPPVDHDLKKASKAETKAIEKDVAGTNVQGESSDFLDYLNDDVFLKDEEIVLGELDEDSRVVLGDESAEAGVAVKMGFEENPIFE